MDQDSLQTAINPLKIPEVVSIVLKLLPHWALRNCRLVNKLWCKESSKEMQNCSKIVISYKTGLEILRSQNIGPKFCDTVEVKLRDATIFDFQRAIEGLDRFKCLNIFFNTGERYQTGKTNDVMMVESILLMTPDIVALKMVDATPDELSVLVDKISTLQLKSLSILNSKVPCDLFQKLMTSELKIEALQLNLTISSEEEGLALCNFIRSQKDNICELSLEYCSTRTQNHVLPIFSKLRTLTLTDDEYQMDGTVILGKRAFQKIEVYQLPNLVFLNTSPTLLTSMMGGSGHSGITELNLKYLETEPREQELLGPIELIPDLLPRLTKLTIDFSLKRKEAACIFASLIKLQALSFSFLGYQENQIDMTICGLAVDRRMLDSFLSFKNQPTKFEHIKEFLLTCGSPSIRDLKDLRSLEVGVMSDFDEEIGPDSMGITDASAYLGFLLLQRLDFLRLETFDISPEVTRMLKAHHSIYLQEYTG